MVLLAERVIVKTRDKGVLEVVGKRLRATRYDRNWTLEVVAEKLGVARQTLIYWESGRSFPGPANLKAVVTLYKVSVDWLIGREGPNPEEANILEGFRSLPSEGKAILRGALRGMLEHEAHPE